MFSMNGMIPVGVYVWDEDDEYMELDDEMNKGDSTHPNTYGSI